MTGVWCECFPQVCIDMPGSVVVLYVVWQFGDQLICLCYTYSHACPGFTYILYIQVHTVAFKVVW